MATSSAVSFLATLQSFFRDLLGNLPDGVNDTTEGIRRDGNIGLFVDPLSSLDINGSLGTSIRTDAGSGAIAVLIAQAGIAGNNGQPGIVIITEFI